MPTNVAVPRADYLADVRILSLAGWRPYEGPASLVEPMRRYFLEQAVGHYPALRGRLDPRVDLRGRGRGARRRRGAARSWPSSRRQTAATRRAAASALARVPRALDASYYEPLALRGAVARYAEWQRSNPKATPAARRQLAAHMRGLYGLDAHGEIARYHLYRRTLLRRCRRRRPAAFDRAAASGSSSGRASRATRLVELSELQAALASRGGPARASASWCSRASSRCRTRSCGARPAGRASCSPHVVDSRVGHFTVREPAGPAEVGRLYRLLADSGLAPGPASRQLVLLDREERVVGGITWRTAAPRVAHVEGVVVAPALRSQRLAAALVEDFCARLASAGYVAIHTHFGPGPFPFAPGFRVDRRWGGLVRFLEPSRSRRARAPSAVPVR